MTTDPRTERIAALRHRIEDAELASFLRTEEYLQPGPGGWVEPTPGPCSCGSPHRLIGFHHCPCRGGPFEGGHRTWGCRECSRVVVGCRMPGRGWVPR